MKLASPGAGFIYKSLLEPGILRMPGSTRKMGVFPTRLPNLIRRNISCCAKRAISRGKHQARKDQEGYKQCCKKFVNEFRPPMW
jgi:hypothetical protein